jgi:hypothetical protein
MSYVAGCRDSGVGVRTDLYDVLVNLPAREITVATHAKGNSIAVILSRCEAPSSDSDINHYITVRKLLHYVVMWMTKHC